jgi:hypothetical protein
MCRFAQFPLSANPNFRDHYGLFNGVVAADDPSTQRQLPTIFRRALKRALHREAK